MSALRLLANYLAITTLSVGTLHAQDFPSRPVRIMCIGPGGSSDFTARVIASGISGTLGQPVVVENRAGLLAMDAVAKAAPDGYTFLLAGGNFWIAPLLEKTTFDPIKNYSPVILPVRSPAVLVVHPSLPVKSVKELIALAKARPKALNYSSTTTGGAAHLSAELFNSMAGVDIVRVPYKATGQSINDLIGGHVQLSFPQSSAVETFVNSGRLRALAVTSAQPSALFPNLPTVAATLPGYESANFLGVFAPANTPSAIISRMNQEIARYLLRPEAKERFKAAGAEIVGGTPEDLSSAVKADITRLSKLIRDLNIKIE